MKNYRFLKWVFPLLLLIALAPFSTKLDCFLSGLFYQPQTQTFSEAFYHHYIYYWGVIPALVTGIGSGLLLISSYFIKGLKKHQATFLFLSLSMCIGAGVLVHLVFKNFWFRPRPLQTTLFGGLEAFRPFYSFTYAHPNVCKSFPSGHASMGFYFINLIILGSRLSLSWLIRLGALLTIVMSFLLCFSRIAQGAHFFSDTFASLCVTWYAAWITDYFVFDFLAKKQVVGYIEN